MNWTPDSKEHRDIAKLWEDPDAFGTALVAILVDNYGTEIFDVDAEVIADTVAADFNCKPLDDNMDKAMSLILVITTDHFWHTWESFHLVCDALTGNGADMHTWSPLSPEEMAWGITEAMVNDPAEQPKKDPVDGAPPKPASRFSEEVRRYMGVLLQEQGVNTATGMLADAVFVNAVNTMPTDPVMHKAYVSRKEGITAEVDEFVHRRLAALIFQLKKLPLRHRDQKAWQRFLAKLPSRLSLSKGPEAQSEEHGVALL